MHPITSKLPAAGTGGELRVVGQRRAFRHGRTPVTRRIPDAGGRYPQSAPSPSSANYPFIPVEARPSMTRRCSTMNRISTGAMASRLAAISTG